eukprot:TRINITY_DN38038_c0_g1_i1.p1 TRINITY_DN38038_c0_g1~~TRINITY_DN38038_c0_g1_i1.p1  ORF type:complete len:747 (+),score=148.76 TRINITY_DN38038_c0_g1_i1:166-2406(+)
MGKLPVATFRALADQLCAAYAQAVVEQHGHGDDAGSAKGGLLSTASIRLEDLAAAGKATDRQISAIDVDDISTFGSVFVRETTKCSRRSDGSTSSPGDSKEVRGSPRARKQTIPLKVLHGPTQGAPEQSEHLPMVAADASTWEGVPRLSSASSPTKLSAGDSRPKLSAKGLSGNRSFEWQVAKLQAQFDRLRCSDETVSSFALWNVMQEFPQRGGNQKTMAPKMFDDPEVVQGELCRWSQEVLGSALPWDDDDYWLDFSAFSRLCTASPEELAGCADDTAALVAALRGALHREGLHDLEENTRASLEADTAKDVQLQKNILDTVSAVVILLNAAVIGISADHDQEHIAWQVLELLFTLFFFGELLIKLKRDGCLEFFIGSDFLWNIFDFFIVGVALLDLACSAYMLLSGEEGLDLGGIMIIKIMRLVRLARLVKLLRFKIFHELKMMIQGVFAGFRVLFWAVVLLFFFIFLIGVATRNSMGTEPLKSYANTLSFERVDWAMFTLFRCLTDGCVAYDGTPLQLHLFAKYGAGFMLTYVILFLFVTIGIFNLIMAIFIDNVMHASALRKAKERGENAMMLETRLKELIHNLIRCDNHARESPPLSGPRALIKSCRKLYEGMANKILSSSQVANKVKLRSTKVDYLLDSIAGDDATITRDVFNSWLRHQDLLDLLDELDVVTANKAELFDVLDCDLSGELEIGEVVSGIMKLRGAAEKNDIVATLLGVRYMTALLKDIHEKVCGGGEPT